MSISSVQAERPTKRQPKVDAPLADACWIDRMRLLAAAECLAWSVYLKLPQPVWQAARGMFRRAFDGDAPETNLLRFLTEAHVEDRALVGAMEIVLEALAKEAALYRRWSGKRG